MEESYKKIIENMEDAIVVTQEEKIEYINSSALKKLGYKKEEVLQRNFLDFVSEKDKGKVLKNYTDTLKKGVSFFYEAEFKTKNGEKIYTEVRSQKIEYKGGVADLAVIRDIRTRKKAERVFHEQEERFRALTENTPDIIIRFDEECRYVYVNTAAEKEFGVPKENFFWKTDKDLGIGDERTEALRDAIRTVFKERKKKTFYSEVIINGEKKYYYTILVPEFFTDGTVNSVLSITRDITEIREIDQAKSEFISITSHQLRSPLSVINWCTLSLLREDAGEIKKEQKEFLERIYESTRNLIKITDVFLNTTMLDLEMFVFNPKNLDVGNFIEEVLGEFKKSIERRKITVYKKYEKNIFAKIDPRVLKIILRGVVSNAIEYTSKEGKVDIVTYKEKDKIVLRIGDNGCGVPQEDMKKVFTKFYRAKPARNMKAYGTGLDLYLVKSLLEKIEGSVELESPNPDYKKGSVFFIYLPGTFDSNL